MKARIAKLATSSRLPRRTVRLRLTLIYGGLFLVSGAILLAITYLLVSHSTGRDLLVFKAELGPERDEILRELGSAPQTIPLPQVLKARTGQLERVAEERDAEILHELLVQSGVALALMAIISVALGWLVAGRVLRPLRTMTETTQRISHENLHERLDLRGPDDELKALADTIDELLGRLEAAFEAQSRFVANASHELRTPLAMMRTSLDVATAKPEPIPEQVLALDGKLREGLNQAESLLEGFLLLSRADHGGFDEGDRVDLASLLRDAVRADSDPARERGIAIEQELQEAVVEGDAILLSRLVANLVDNAIRHNEEGGCLRARTGAGKGVAWLEVESGGERIDQAQAEQLVQPFRRLGRERTGSGGVGLGLSIVAAIARAHGGVVVVRARAGGGLSVHVSLPAASSPSDEGGP